MRQPTSLPTYLRFERLDDNGTCKMQFVCDCGYAETGKRWPHTDETLSTSELRCPQCRAYIKVTVSKEV